jgi:hypothetical protein
MYPTENNKSNVDCGVLGCDIVCFAIKVPTFGLMFCFHYQGTITIVCPVYRVRSELLTTSKKKIDIKFRYTEKKYNIFKPAVHLCERYSFTA